MHSADHGEYPRGVRGRAAFEGTRWSVVIRARDSEPRAAEEALSELCRIYWYPLYAFARRSGLGHHEAEDLAQGFFEHLIGRDGLANVAPGKGRFRSFLLASLKHFMANERDRAQALKRGGGQVPVSIDMIDAEGRYNCEPRDNLTPDVVYERGWAIALLDATLEQLRQECEERGKGAVFDALQPSIVGDPQEMSYADIGKRLDMTEANVKVFAHRLRRRFGELLRLQVADTVEREEDIDEEIRSLMQCFS